MENFENNNTVEAVNQVAERIFKAFNEIDL